MTSCLAVNETTVIVSSIDDDKCFVYSLENGTVKNLTQCLGESYENMPINNRDLQKACAAFSADGKLFAYNPNKGKLLSIWNTTDWSLVENKTLAKHATIIVFTPKSNVIVVGDKKGDIYAFEELPVRILGHSSMILDICFSNDEKYIITCDSDEKVRISHYPNGKNIMYYLMGHEAYVSGVCMLNNFILSGSGDCTLRLWDFNNGELLSKFTLYSPVQSIFKIEDMAAVHLYDSKEIHFIKANKNENNWLIKKIKTIKFESNILDLASHGNQLWINSGNSIQNYTVDSSNEIILKNENYEIMQACKILDDLVKSFVRLEHTNLMIFLYKKMVDKLKRIDQCDTPDSRSLIQGSKKIKIASK